MKKIVPWGIALGIFFFLFRQYPLPRLIQATRHANLLFLICFSIIYFLYMWRVDCWGLARTLTRFGVPTKTSEIVQVRAASYLVMILNYGMGQGTFTFFINRKKGVPFLKASSIILFVTGIDLYWVTTFAFAGSLLKEPFFSGLSLTRPIQLLWGGITIGLIVLTLLAHAQMGEKIRWLQRWGLFHVLHEGHIRHYLATLFERLPMHLAINASLYFVAWGFHASLSLFTVFSSVPVIILIGTIPITPGGLGTVQIATVELLKGSLMSPLFQKGITAEELLLSMSLFWMFANYSLKALFGSLHLREFYHLRSIAPASPVSRGK